VVNDRHLRGKPMLFTTNKSPLTQWGEALHDSDLADAIVDRTLERGRLLILDGPSHRTRLLDLDTEPHHAANRGARLSGEQVPDFPELTLDEAS
jgi:hypothetical protein